MKVQKLTSTVLVSDEMMDDARGMRTAIAVMLVKAPSNERYKRVYSRGYWAAVEDFRSGRLVVIDGAVEVGHATV